MARLEREVKRAAKTTTKGKKTGSRKKGPGAGGAAKAEKTAKKLLK